jgi:hypothetical protein
MLEDEDLSPEHAITDEWLYGHRAKVYWQSEVMVAFPKVSDRRLILQAIEKTMISCRTATLYYCLEQVCGHFLKIESTEAETVILVTVEMGAPILVDVPEESLGFGPEAED